MRFKAKRSGRKGRDLNYFKPGTCNTIDDRTGFKIKLDECTEEWDGLVVRSDLADQRQPQDYPVTPVAQKVYKNARAEDEENIKVYTPIEDVTKL